MHATFSSHQLNGRFSDLCVRCFGRERLRGYALRRAGPDRQRQEDKVWNGTEKDDTFTGGCVTNIKNFIESIADRQADQ